MGLALRVSSLVCLAALVVAAVAGCGDQAGRAAEPAITASAPSAPLRTVRQPFGPPSGTKTQAAKFVRHLLSTIVLPAGARRLPQRPVPAAFGGTPVDWGEGSGTGLAVSVSGHRLWSLPLPMPAAYAFLRAHPPADEVSGSYGSIGVPGAVTAEDIYALARKVPSGLGTSKLQYMMVPSPAGGSLLLVGVQVYWHPPRPAAEDFVASNFRAVTVWDSIGSPGHGGSTFTAGTIISQVVRRLDEVYIGTPVTFCGIYGITILLHPASPRQPTVYLAGVGCGVFFVQVGSRQEPPLSASTSLINLVRKLLGQPPDP
jgi:hypothetical protein